MSDERLGPGGKEFQRVLDQLREWLSDGTYAVGSRLATQRHLAEEFGVSRDTIQRVLRVLIGEGWIEARQGSGARVVKVSRVHSAGPAAERVHLGKLIDQAFEHPEVTLDVALLTSESLDAHVRLQADRITSREIHPERITVRMLLPSESSPLPYPRAKHDPDDPRPQERLRSITRAHTESLRRVLRELQSQGLVPSATVEIRRVPLVPTFKLYVLNGVTALFGPYEVVQRRIVMDDGEEIEVVDVLGLGSDLSHYVKEETPGAESQGSLFVRSMESWFNSCWELLSE
ncbi:winged helix-turn-helix domain-containing protein [Streptomyces sp. NPDC051214]|uniref:winged helix-turn-helix domain-containing protein n=1 Tax=Streptomyces sp. NPDC051214 TaxID=3155282 RepID=UPI00342E9DAD